MTLHCSLSFTHKLTNVIGGLWVVPTSVGIVAHAQLCAYGGRPKTVGLDLTNRSKSGKPSEGLMLHNTLALTPEGMPLELLDQRFIDRQRFLARRALGKHRQPCSGDPIEHKESRRWIDVIRQCQAMDFGKALTVHVGDREADIYELFRDAAALNEHVLVRAARNRAIDKHRGRPWSTDRSNQIVRRRQHLTRLAFL